MMEIHSKLPGVRIIQPAVHGDTRGYFVELWSARRYEESLGPAPFVQDNVSFSRRGILRGLHFQNPNAQGKLVGALEGEVFDVAVDLRRNSPTFGQWEGFQLSGESKRQVYLPPGLAHGFQVLSETALLYYKCTGYYSAGDEHILRWDDPDLGIQWPISEPVLSAKDASAKRFRDLTARQLFDLP